MLAIGLRTARKIGWKPCLPWERWTKKNLDFVNVNYPGAFYQDVRYVCVAGKTVRGDRSADGPRNRTLREWFTYNSYQLTCGQGDCWGDGITPIAAAPERGSRKSDPRRRLAFSQQPWYLVRYGGPNGVLGSFSRLMQVNGEWRSVRGRPEKSEDGTGDPPVLRDLTRNRRL